MKTVNRTNSRICPELRATLSGIQYPAMLELKLDGELDWCVFDGNEIYLINKRGRVRTDMPILDAIQKQMNGKPFEIVGELYAGPGKNHDLYLFNSMKDSDDLNFYPFDITVYEGQSIASAPLVDRKEILVAHLWDVIPAKPRLVYSERDVNDEFLKACKAGYEGVVVKNLNGHYITGPCPWVKLKFTDANDYPVSLIDPVQERIEVIVRSVTPAGAPLIRQVGVKCSHRIKAGLKVGSVVTIQHHGLMEGGSLRNPVFIGVKKP